MLAYLSINFESLMSWKIEGSNISRTIAVVSYENSERKFIIISLKELGFRPCPWENGKKPVIKSELTSRRTKSLATSESGHDGQTSAFEIISFISSPSLGGSSFWGYSMVIFRARRKEKLVHSICWHPKERNGLAASTIHDSSFSSSRNLSFQISFKDNQR